MLGSNILNTVARGNSCFLLEKTQRSPSLCGKKVFKMRLPITENLKDLNFLEVCNEWEST